MSACFEFRGRRGRRVMDLLDAWNVSYDVHEWTGAGVSLSSDNQQALRDAVEIVDAEDTLDEFEKRKK